MTTRHAEQIQDLLETPDSADLSDRVAAIQALGNIGNADALKRLRERLASTNQELSALVIAVGK